MASKHLGRECSPLGEGFWKRLDEIVMNAAKSRLSARRILDVEGPYGLGLKSVPLEDQIDVDGEVKVVTSEVLPLSLIQTTFTLGARDIATFEESGFSLDSGSVAEAAMAIAAMEDSLIYEGNEKVAVEGLLNAAGVQSLALGDWDDVGTAANDVIAAISKMDESGFHGPYSLALAPELFNKLYRLYSSGQQSELRHIETIIGSKPVKASGIKSGGVLLASGSQFASIVIGQDMMTGFIGPDNGDYKLTISESLALRLRAPSAVCVLTA
jgi:uncharacterized linocin/CFP29 family protein